MNFDLILKGINEFYPKLNNKIYNILKVDNKKKEEYMIELFNNFTKDITKNQIIGLDFEFNTVSKTNKDVALMQLNLEDNTNIGYIFLLLPPSLEKKNLEILIKLMSNPNIIKILHGGESLDIPYLFNQLLITKENINGFCSKFYDTKYLCDYSYLDLETKAKCSIYNLLLDNKIITQEKIDELNKIEEITGPIYLLTMDIYNLSDELFKYSLYDVIYLPELLNKFLMNGDVYALIIPEVASIIHKYKRNIETEFIELEKLITKCNLNFFFIDKEKYILKDVWEMYFFTIIDKHNYMNKLFEIHYFKHFFDIITKLLVYINIIKNYKVFKYQDIKGPFIDFNKYLLWLKQYPHVNNLLTEFYYIVKNNIKQI